MSAITHHCLGVVVVVVVVLVVVVVDVVRACWCGCLIWLNSLSVSCLWFDSSRLTDCCLWVMSLMPWAAVLLLLSSAVICDVGVIYSTSR